MPAVEYPDEQKAGGRTLRDGAGLPSAEQGHVGFMPSSQLHRRRCSPLLPWHPELVVCHGVGEGRYLLCTPDAGRSWRVRAVWYERDDLGWGSVCGLTAPERGANFQLMVQALRRAGAVVRADEELGLLIIDESPSPIGRRGGRSP